MATVAHIYLFPYFLYPALSIAVTGSVYMTVAIAIGKLKFTNICIILLFCPQHCVYNHVFAMAFMGFIHGDLLLR